MNADRKPTFGDWMYRRIGWWMLILFNGVVWLFGVVITAVLIVILARVQPLTSDQTLQYAVRLGLVWIVFIAASMAHAVIAVRPLRALSARQTTVPDAWRAVVLLPTRIMKFNYSLAGLGTVLGLICLGQVEPLDAPLVALYLLGNVGLLLYQLGAVTFISAAFVRPILRSISAELTGAMPPDSGLRLFARTVFVMPALSVSMAVLGAGLALSEGIGPGSAAVKLLLVLVVATVATVPVTFAFAHSVNVPIEDLLDGTKRIKVGDYSTRVPELSPDELGELARSFNEAMEGLSERQRLGREVRASRARIVAAADESRKRIERNIHDGAQQRLVALALDLRLLEEMAGSMTPEEVVTTARQAGDAVKDALAELRELARGLHPQVLTTDGLGPALSQLASRSKVSVRVDAPTQRFSEPVETAAYFVVAEALANVAKYAKAQSAQVTVQASNGSLWVEVADDGIGGASVGAGSGLAGLSDRVAALDGRLTIESPYGSGTKVRAEIPVRR